MTKFTRRDLIDSMVVTAAAMAMGPLASLAQPEDEESLQKVRDALLKPAAYQDFLGFIRVSSALTGIADVLLAPASKSTKDKNGQPIVDAADPTQAVKLAYFNLARAHPAYPSLMEEFRGKAGNGGASAKTLNDAALELISSMQPIQELARSIIMAWYFGVWYEWNVPNDKPRFTIISADAYTQGWAWRIVEAHPAGYSNMRFGHWAFEPPLAFKPDAITQKGDRT